MNVLVIDDSVTNVRAVEKFLEEANVEIFTASNGADGISIVLENQIDLIFLDIEMPMFSGYDISMILKSNEKTAHIPIVMVSSRDGLFDPLKGLAYKANDYITKPYKKENLLKMIAKYE